MEDIFFNKKNENVLLLKNAHKKNRVPHNQLFIGNYGRGGLLLSLWEAFFLFNEKEPADTKDLFSVLSHPDLHLIFPTQKDLFPLQTFIQFAKVNPYGNPSDWQDELFLLTKKKTSGFIGIDSIKTVIPKLYLKSFLAKNRICIIWGFEKANKSATNKILKILEEPPANTYFILIANSDSFILPTILSRSQILLVRPFLKEKIAESLMKAKTEHSKALAVANMCYGSWGEAINILKNKKKLFWIEEKTIIFFRLAFMSNNNSQHFIKLLSLSEELASLEKNRQKLLLQNFGMFIREGFLKNYPIKTETSMWFETKFDIMRFAPFINTKNVFFMVSLIEKSIKELERNANPQILFTNFSIKIARQMKAT